MLQVLQNLKSGELTLKEVPPPALTGEGVIVRNASSLISAGTEKMLIELARKNLLAKAQSRPDLVKQVLNKAKKEGWVSTFRNVMSKMERPMPLGYSASGIIEQAGESVKNLNAGDRVAIAGAGYANHAEVNFVPKNLVVPIPDGVTFEEAAYTTVSSIALQGVRLAHPELGDYAVVIGLGLLGLITVQLLKAAGLKVIGSDYDQKKIEKALSLGMDEAIFLPKEDAIARVEQFTHGYGADHTFITAATQSNEPVELAGEITRRKGQVIIIGLVGMNIPRDQYYKKELELKVSMSYGPGRYDYSYEEGGIDYPYDYVRWTEQRNMQAVLELMAQKKLDVLSLTTHRFDFRSAEEAYALITNQSEPFIGILLNYDITKPQEKILYLPSYQTREARMKGDLGVGFIGAGNYASVQLLPNILKEKHVKLTGLVTATGLNAQQKADKFGFEYCTTDTEALLKDASTNAVFIATRHSTHAKYTMEAMRNGKKVFVEKPFVVSETQLCDVVELHEHLASEKTAGTALMVGLNRRFASISHYIRKHFPENTPLQMLYRVNSGTILSNTWLHAPEEGGGMLVGEVCHFIDLMMYICRERPAGVYARTLSTGNDLIPDEDNLSVVITFDRGSVGTLLYSTVGNKLLPKERLEVYGGGRIAVMDDFRTLDLISGSESNKYRSGSQDKGQSRMIRETIKHFRNSGTSPIPFDQLVNVMRTVFAIKKSIKNNTYQPVELMVFNEQQNEVPA